MFLLGTINFVINIVNCILSWAWEFKVYRAARRKITDSPHGTTVQDLPLSSA
jgi:hypothetical protein